MPEPPTLRLMGVGDDEGVPLLLPRPDENPPPGLLLRLFGLPPKFPALRWLLR